MKIGGSPCSHGRLSRSRIPASCSDTCEIAASPSPVDVQVAQCQQFIDRTVGRITELDRDREIESSPLEEARNHLQRLQLEAVARASIAPDVNPDNTDINMEVVALKANLATTEAERDALSAEPRSKIRHTDAGGVSGRFIPPMPCLVPAELDNWMKERHGDLQEALEFGEGERVWELISNLSDAAVRMLEMSDKKCHDTRHRGDGLRGVRVGEAENPGPGGRQCSDQWPESQGVFRR